MQIYSKCDIGKVRHSNQDAFFAAEIEHNAVFAIVCDGMGGANAGNVASETAVRIISDYIMRSYRLSMDTEATEKMIKNAIESANIEIYDTALKNPELQGMGTTVVIAIAEGDRAVIAHVGDSRAYLINDKIKQLTRDHSVVQSLVESGKISAEDAKVHPEKNVITRALGAEENVIADITHIPFSKGESLLLCTDGLSSFIDEKSIFESVSMSDGSAADKLVDKANENGGGDNITVVILDK